MHPTANQLLMETLIRIDGAYAPSTIRPHKLNLSALFISVKNRTPIVSRPTHLMLQAILLN